MQKEINKLLKRVQSEKLKNNLKECIELYNIVGGLYSEVGSYDEAIHYHEQALDLSRTIGDQLKTALALRFIGEAKAALGQFYQAIDCIKKYLDLAHNLDNKIEMQRAYTTLGRVYLMHAQELKDTYRTADIIDGGQVGAKKRIHECAREAESRFKTALQYAEHVRDQIEEKEYKQMQSSLFINLGLVKDLRGMHQEAMSKFNRAIVLCKEAKLKEDLYRCLNIMSAIYRQRYDVKNAVKTSEEALQVAKSIGKKILICEALIERGLIRVCQRDYKNAKRTLAKAYLEKSPSEDDHLKAIRLTKLAYLIGVTFDKLTQSDESGPSETRLKLCDKLGDLFVAIGYYKFAIEYYRRAFTEGKLSSKSKPELARILYSIAETYADDEQYSHALACYEKELQYRMNGSDQEQCQSLVKIAHMHEYLDHESEKVCDAYEKAYKKAGKEPKLMYQVLKYYVPYLKHKSIRATRFRELEDILLNLKSYPEVVDEMERENLGEIEDEDVDELEDEVANIDDIITDDEDNDEVLMLGRRRTKSKGSSKFKTNEVGDTPLHEACIRGDFKRVKCLLDQGHDINPRDNAGWIPLHEACNHGHFEIAEYLIERGADVNNRGLKGMTPLHDAATNGHFDIMRLLMQNGANVIALTDTGETILGCFRDYKKRSGNRMSNREAAEYKAIEADLLNLMDKSGYSLIALTKSEKEAIPDKRAEPALVETPRVKKTGLEGPMTNAVKEFRDTIGSLKRKRLPKDDEKKTDQVPQPACYSSSYNTSASTKDWLIDDVSRQPNKKIYVLNSDDEDDDIDLEEKVEEPKDNVDVDIVDIDKDDVDTIELNGENMTPCSDHQLDNADDDFDLPQESSDKGREIEEIEPVISQEIPAQQIDVLKVDIEGERKLLIPVKAHFTIKDLKQSIVERYSVTLEDGAQPRISLSPWNEPECQFYDGDLCKDVIREEKLMARIESWDLKSIESTYLEECKKSSVEPEDFMRSEMQNLDELGQRLDLSFVRLAGVQMRPMIRAIARRQFASANFNGSSSLFDNYLIAEQLLATIMTWKNLQSLSLQCIGLLRSQFESIYRRLSGGGGGKEKSSSSSSAASHSSSSSAGKVKLAQLVSLDVSFNSIAYKSREEFTRQLELICEAFPRLELLDVRENPLQFAKLRPLAEPEGGAAGEQIGCDGGAQFKLRGGELRVLVI